MSFNQLPGKPPLPTGTSQQSPTSSNGGASAPMSGVRDEKQLMVDKIKSLESKLQFYETEHNNYQNQLLLQRKSHEEEIKQLKLTI